MRGRVRDVASAAELKSTINILRVLFPDRPQVAGSRIAKPLLSITPQQHCCGSVVTTFIRFPFGMCFRLEIPEVLQVEKGEHRWSYEPYQVTHKEVNLEKKKKKKLLIATVQVTGRRIATSRNECIA